MRYRLLFVIVAAGLLLPAGCSSSGPGGRGGNKVTGKVTMAGNPVAGAKVIFTDGKASGAMVSGPSAITDDDGSYTLVGVPPGTYKVVVYKFNAKPGAKLPPEGEGMDMEQIEASGLGSHALPQKYSKPDTTTLSANVESGTNKDVDFDLKGK